MSNFCDLETITKMANISTSRKSGNLQYLDYYAPLVRRKKCHSSFSTLTQHIVFTFDSATQHNFVALKNEATTLVAQDDYTPPLTTTLLRHAEAIVWSAREPVKLPFVHVLWQ